MTVKQARDLEVGEVGRALKSLLVDDVYVEAGMLVMGVHYEHVLCLAEGPQFLRKCCPMGMDAFDVEVVGTFSPSELWGVRQVASVTGRRKIRL